MNFKSLLVVGLGVATLGLSLPAHADQATVVDTTQDAVVTGDKNYTGQSSDTNVKNRESGRPSGDSTGSSVRTKQSADVLGDKNTTLQDSTTKIENSRRTPRK